MPICDMVFHSNRNLTEHKEKVKLVLDFWRIKLTGKQLNILNEGSQKPNTCPPIFSQKHYSVFTIVKNSEVTITIAAVNSWYQITENAYSKNQ